MSVRSKIYLKLICKICLLNNLKMLALNIMSISNVKEEKDKIYPWKVIDEGRLRERFGGNICSFIR